MHELHDLRGRTGRQLRSKRSLPWKWPATFLARAQAHARPGCLPGMTPRVTLAQAALPMRALAAARPARCWACRWPTRTFLSPGTFPPPPARRCWKGYRSPFDATVVERLASAACRDAGQAQLRRVRHGLQQRKLGLWATSIRARSQPVGHRRASPAAPRAAARWPWRRAWRRRPPAPTPAGRSASRPRSVASPASSPPMAALRVTAWWPLPPAWTRPARWRAAPRTVRLLLSAMCGPDPDRDSTSLDVPAEDFTAPAERQHRRPAHWCAQASSLAKAAADVRAAG
jgi:aspartyl-tRNA(Asn)/glutamyl-tRNA(Gln) amidotransferase subunit A